MLRTDFRDEISAREFQIHEWEKESYAAQAELSVKLKELDIEAAKIEARITSWFRIPIYIISIPVKILALIPLFVYAVRKAEVPPELWKLLNT